MADSSGPVAIVAIIAIVIILGGFIYFLVTGKFNLNKETTVVTPPAATTSVTEGVKK